MARSFEFPVGTPPIITKEIIEFCKEIDKSQKPGYVPVKPENWAKSQECFHNVEAKREKDGGRIQFGWAIGEWRNYYLFADFHAIWISPEDESIDITLVSEDTKNTLFLPDSSRKYDYNAEYYRVPIRYYPIYDNPLVHELIAAEKEVFDIEQTHSTGPEIVIEIVDPAHKRIKELHRKIHLIQEQFMLQPFPQPERGKPRRNDPCPCGSGLKFKRCCGK